MFDRNHRVSLVLVIALASLPFAAYGRGGPAPKCSNIPISVTVLSGTGTMADPSVTPVLTGDNNATYGNVYVAGKEGITGSIDMCGSGGSAPSYNATMNLVNSTRTMKLTLPTPSSYANGTPPSWTSGPSQFVSKPTLFIPDILWGRMNNQASFTTRFVMQLLTGPDGALYDLRLQPPYDPLGVNGVIEPNTAPPFPDTNTPYQTASVTVSDTLGTCHTGGATFDSWTVEVTAMAQPSTTDLYIGTLYKQSTRKSAYAQAGQYVVPMKLVVQAQSCVPLTP